MREKPNRVRMSIEFDMPKTYTRREVKAYMKEAIETWGGQRHPDDELFYFQFRLHFGKIECI